MKGVKDIFDSVRASSEAPRLVMQRNSFTQITTKCKKLMKGENENASYKKLL